MASIKHACEMNDVILNWKKLKNFIKSGKTDNETNGKDRGYTHEEIQIIRITRISTNRRGKNRCVPFKEGR